ncbi:CBU_0592 family membrane protein [Maridesulfovibrio sp.]|uniref:CBU_0592 family membrane protein n=1 Tax=Maridesulfovibrio sp. TaxID=2795000 RepID=UPI002A188E0B|nr:hypothetical protein [Maridesulfovibrio sp.]
MGVSVNNSDQAAQVEGEGTSFLFEAVGWYGTVAIVLAYLLVSLGLLDSKGLYYQFLNLTGAVGIVFISIQKRAYQPAVLNIIWSVIALVAIGKAVW